MNRKLREHLFVTVQMSLLSLLITLIHPWLSKSINFFQKQNNLNSSVFITWIFPYAKVTENALSDLQHKFWVEYFTALV